MAGHRGLVGSAIVRALREEKFENIITVTRGDVDLTDPVAVKWFFSSYLPEYVFLCAAKVGGIVANSTQSAEFMLENLRIQDNVISNARDYGVKKLLFLGSACAYPKYAPNPVKEEYLLTGPLEPSNECYALAKISGIKLCQAYRQEYGCNFISCMPTNLYGPGDHYDLQNSHVIPGMIHRIHDAKRAGERPVLWGTGDPVREFLFSDDMAQACLRLMWEYSGPVPVNITSGRVTVLWTLAREICDVVGVNGNSLIWDRTKPDGTPARILDGSILDGMGWSSEVSLYDGLRIAYQDFLCQQH